MTEMLFRTDAYARDCRAKVLSAGPDGVVLDRTVFYAQGGGQPGDTGWLRWEGQEMPVANAVKGENGTVLHKPAEGAPLPAPGTEVTAALDWERRHRLMRFRPWVSPPSQDWNHAEDGARAAPLHHAGDADRDRLHAGDASGTWSRLRDRQNRHDHHAGDHHGRRSRHDHRARRDPACASGCWVRFRDLQRGSS